MTWFCHADFYQARAGLMKSEMKLSCSLQAERGAGFIIFQLARKVFTWMNSRLSGNKKLGEIETGYALVCLLVFFSPSPKMWAL